MTVVTGVVEAVMRIKDETAAGLDRIHGGMKKLAADANGGQTTLRSFAAVASTAFSGIATIAGRMAVDHERAMAAVARGTGATGAELDALQASAARVAGGLRGDFAAVAEATANLRTATGLASTDLEALSRHVAQAAIGMEDDLGRAADDVGRLMRAFGLEGAAAGMALTDHLVAAAQDTGGTMGALAGQVLRLSPSLQSMGLDAKEAAVFVARLNQAGVPADRVLRSLKTTTAEWTEAGHDVRAMLGDTITQVRDAATEQEAYRLAVDLFGSSAAPGMTQAIRSGVVPSLDQLAGTLGDTSGATQTLYDDTGQLWSELQVWGNKITATVGSVLPLLTSAISGAGGAISAFGVAVPKVAILVSGAARAMWAGITGPVGLVVAALAAVGTAAWAFRGQLADALAAVIDFVVPWVDRWLGAMEAAAGWIPGFGNELSGLVATARGKLDDLASGATSSLREYSRSFDEASPAAAGLADELEGELTPAAEGAGGALTGIAPAAAGAAGALEDAGDAMARIGGIAEATRTELAIFGGRLVRLHGETAEQSAERFWSAWSAGMTGPSAETSISTTIPEIAGGIGLEPAWAGAGGDAATGMTRGFAEVWAPNNVAGIFREAFAGGGGVGGAIAGIGSELGGQLMTNLQARVSEGSAGLLSSVGGAFGPLGGLLSGALTGGISAAVDFGLRALGRLGAKINDWFGGPDEAELAGRAAAESWLSGLASRASTDQSIEALRAGWEDADLAKSWIVLRDSVLEAGGTIQDAERWWGRMQEAIRRGGDDVELVRLEFLQFTEAATGAGEAVGRSTETIVHDAQEIGRQFRGLTEQEAQELGAELERLGNRAHRGFSLIHSSSLAAGNALASVMLPAVQTLRGALDEAAGAAGRLGSAIRRIPDVPAVPAPPAPRPGGFAAGGIARGPDSGYLALLHGTETVVPGAHPGLLRTAPPAAAAPSNAGRPVQIVIHTDSTHDGRAVARAVARHLPAELRRAGVTI